MRAPPSRPLSLSLSVLLVGCALAWPADGQGLPDAPAPRAGAAAEPGGHAVDVAPPDLPANVTFTPSDLDAGDKAREAPSRPVADPPRVLQADAPGDGTTTDAKAPPSPALAMPAVPGIVMAPPPSSPVVSEAPVAPAAAPSTGERKDEAAKVAEPAPPPPAAPVEAAKGLDPAALRTALDAYVGAEPPPTGGRVPPLEQARYKDRQAVRAVYMARAFSPIWIEDGRFDAKARSVLARIDHAAEDALDLHAGGVAVPKNGDAAALAGAELALSEAAIAYGRQASGGRVDPSRISASIAARPDVADPARILNGLIAAEDAGEALRAFNPPQKGYALLRAKLAELRRTSDVAATSLIPYGPMLRPGMRDTRVPLIRARFGLDMPPDDSGEDGLVYDIEVAAAVADFQKAHHLPASGVLTIRTVAALAGGDPRRIEDEVIANMERWRWVPRDMGENHVEVNLPDFTLSVMHGESVFHHARVVVGQPDKPTPVFSQTMQFIIVNPYWNVPLSIVKKEMMPKLAADPDYFANHGYETVERDGQTYVRQPPGDSNALGRIKFMFPNKYSVYLHDTNARALFGNERRALSHGCVRVEAPFKFAEAVLGKENGWTEARVKRLIGGNERTINLPQPLPIHILYFTAFVDEGGELQLRDDVYGYSAKVKAALGLDGAARAGQVAVN